MPDPILVPVSWLLGDVLPASWVSGIDGALDRIAVEPRASAMAWTSVGLATRHRLVVLEEVSLELPLLPGATLRLGRAGELPSFELHLVTRPAFRAGVDELPFTLAFPPRLLRAYERSESGDWEPGVTEPDPEVPGSGGEPRGYALTFTTGLVVGPGGSVDFLEPEPSEAPALGIGETGFVLHFEPPEEGGSEDAAPGITAVMGDVPESLMGRVPPEFRGLWIRSATLEYVGPDLRLPPLRLTDGAIGEGGFSGTLEVGGQDPPASLLASAREALEPDAPADAVPPDDVLAFRIGDFRAYAHHLALTFEDSLPAASALRGEAFLPLADEWVAFDASLGGPRGDFALEIAGAGDGALFELSTEWLEIRAESVEYVLRDGVHWAVVTGSVRPKLEGFDWPEVRVEGLEVSSEGDVHLPGGWLELPRAATLDFHAFRVDLEAFGVGTKETEERPRRWLGFSGGINLVEGIPLSASVEGLRFTWPVDDPGDVQVSLEGVEVFLEIPGMLVLEGSVSYREVEGGEGDEGHSLEGHLFKGHVDVDLPSLKTSVGAELMIGRLRREGDGGRLTVFYVAADADLPSPIPLGGSGAGIYSLQGLFGMHAGPERGDRSWYEWYRLDTEAGEAGATSTAYDITTVKKWGPAPGEYAFGAGLLVGTQFDDGRTVNVNALAVVLVPGPVVMIEGRANILKAMPDDRSSEGALRALAVIDGRAGTFQLNVDANYSLSRILEVAGSLEAFFDFHDAGNWHVHLGKKTPMSKRLRADVLSIITAQAYLMLDASGIATGARAGYDLKKTLGPASVELTAVVAFDASIFWKPVQLAGRFEMEGALAIEIFGIGLGLGLYLLLEGKAPAPYWIHGVARISLTLPFPLPDPTLKLEFTWEKEGAPDAVHPLLKEGGAVMSHHRQKEPRWPLPESRFETEPDDPPPVPADAPVVPVDARPILTFARPLHHLMEAEPDVVDDYEFTYELPRLELLVREPDGSYEAVKRFPLTSDITETPFQLAVEPDLEAQEPRVELWRYEPMGGAGRRWHESQPWHGPGCVDESTEVPTTCVDWEDEPADTTYAYHFTVDELGLGVDASASEAWSLPVPRVEGVEGRRVLLSPAPLSVRFPEPVAWVRITVVERPPAVGPGIEPNPGPVEIETYKEGMFQGTVPVLTESGVLRVHQADVSGVDSLRIRPLTGGGSGGTGTGPGGGIVVDPTDPGGGGASPGGDDVPPGAAIVEICYRTTAEEQRRERRDRDESVAEDDGGRGAPSLALEPGRDYALHVTTHTRVGRIGRDSSDRTEEHTYLFFRTATGPRYHRPEGLTGRTGYEDAPRVPDFADGPLNRLDTYVARTVPADGARWFHPDYDVAVEFDEPYVREMYPDDEELSIRLLDQAGRPVGSGGGDWVGGRLPLLSAGLLSWLAEREARGCLDEEDDPAPERPTLSSPAGGALEPDALYQAEVVLESTEEEPGEPPAPLHRFRFSTSRFSTVSDQLTSGPEDDDGRALLRPGPTVDPTTVDDLLRPIPGDSRTWADAYADAESRLTSARASLAGWARDVLRRDLPAVADDLAASDRARADLAEIRSRAFQALYPGLGLDEPYRPLPPDTEITRVAASDRSGVLLLLESPEPLPWTRLTVSSRSARGGEEDERPVRTLASEDGTRAFLLPHDGAWWGDRGDFILTFEMRGDQPDLPLLSITDPETGDTTAVEETVEIRIRIG
ncbi:MAG: hypothetical protein ACOC8K_01205 [Gemmatimonadota bacterium]